MLRRLPWACLVTIRTPESLVSEFYGDAIPEPSFINSTVTSIKFDSDRCCPSRGFQADISPICDIITTETHPTIPPVIQPIEPLTVRRGLPTRITCTVIRGDLPIHLRWLKDGEAIPHGVGIEFVNGAFYSSLVIADASTVHDGRYTCEARNLAAAVNYTTDFTVQEHVIELERGESLYVKTPRYIFAYFGDVEGFYAWIVKAPENCTVNIEFRGLTAKVPGDVLEIGSGYNTSTNHIWNLTETQATIPRWFDIDSNVVWMWFRSNGHMIPASNGFCAVLRPTCDQYVNAQSYIDTRGSGIFISSGDSYTIASPNFPQNHPPYLTRIWLIKLPQPDCQLTIDFDNFTTRSDSDKLEISSSASLDTVRAVLYGDVIKEPINITSDYVLIRFETRGYGPDISRGFKAHLYADCEPDVTQPYVDVIGSNVTMSSGDTYYIASLSYPYNNYPSSQNVMWRFFLPEPTCHLSIEFKDFQIGSYHHHKVSISISGSLDDTLVDLSGDVIPDNITLISDDVIIHFSTNLLTGNRGFKAYISAYCVPGATPEPSIDEQGGNISLSDGDRYSIASPNYPYENYPESQDITWSIYLTHQGCQLSITFQDFQTEEVYDKVYIITQDTEDVYTGDVIPDPVNVTSYYVVIRFTSDTVTGYRGFRANLLAQCEEGVSTTTITGQPNEGTTTPPPTTDMATTPVPSTSSLVVPIQQNVTNSTTGELLRRSYSITDRGMMQMFRGWVDVQGQGAPNDFCRVVRTDGKPFLSCLLAGSEEDDLLAYTSSNPSEEWFDPGYSNTWYMKDEDNDGRDDYCRCIGSVPSTLVVCLKAGANGFEGPGSDFLPPNSPEECLFHQADPFFGF